MNRTLKIKRNGIVAYTAEEGTSDHDNLLTEVKALQKAPGCTYTYEYDPPEPRRIMDTKGDQS